jgi:hypothetical protein
MPGKSKHPAAVALGALGGKSGRGAAKRRGDSDFYRKLVALRRDRLNSGMRHRHLNHDRFTRAAIDDIIARGRLPEWRALREALKADPSVRSKVLRVCAARSGDSSNQRYEFWAYYASAKTPA